MFYSLALNLWGMTCVGGWTTLSQGLSKTILDISVFNTVIYCLQQKQNYTDEIETKITYGWRWAQQEELY